MKITFSIFLTIFLTINTAAAQDTLYVYKAGIIAYKSAISTVDSVSFTYIAPVAGTLVDNDGHTYNWRKIGSQTWMTENLRTSKYRNGEIISNITENTAWRTTSGAWCNYNNDIANDSKYGKLYNWYAVNDSRGIAPIGWHVATDAEWTTLINYVTANVGTSISVGKALASTTEWTTNSTAGAIGNNILLNNYSGFNGLPSGDRGDDGNGTFSNLGNVGFWWSSTEMNSGSAWGRDLYYGISNVNSGGSSMSIGFSVRCIKNTSPSLSTSTVNNITANSCSCGGILLDNAGSTILSMGVCWSTSSNPTIADSKTVDGTSIGAFTSLLTGLMPYKTYHVRAYATNNTGTTYGDEVTFSTINQYAEEGTLIDNDGNTYAYKTIGTQTWMTENLKTTKYRNGDFIDNPTLNADWAATTSGAWCNYANNTANGAKYGKLYNWYAVNDSRNIAPIGWHVATDAEWTALTNCVIANLGTSISVVKALAATTDWATSFITGAIGNNLSINNFSGFSAIPGGFRIPDGRFGYLGNTGGWWTTTELDGSVAWARNLLYDYNSVANSVVNDRSSKSNGWSVRCVRDAQ